MKNLILSTFLVLVCLYSNAACSETVYVHSDILGSPIMETNSSGTVTSRSHYKPFGEALEGMKKGVGYTGHLNDKDLELTYMQARYYDPVIGRFYSNDPIGYRGVHSFNRYAYANNNPYKYTDPTGMCSEESSGSKVACAIEDKLTEIIEPIVESAMEAAGVDVKPASERDPNGEFSKVATENSPVGEAAAIIGVVARAKLRGMRKKPGSLGQAKGTDALRRENKVAGDAAKSAGLTKDQRKQLHSEISGQGLDYKQIVEIAKDIKNGN